MCATPRHAELTKLLHRLDLITTVTAAGIFLEEGSPVKLLTLHTLPRERGHGDDDKGTAALSVLLPGFDLLSAGKLLHLRKHAQKELL